MHFVLRPRDPLVRQSGNVETAESTGKYALLIDAPFTDILERIGISEWINQSR